MSFGKVSVNQRGLSPRVRGNPGVDPPGRMGGRSIPACAGEPAGLWRQDDGTQVYPRVCGGTSECALVSAGWEGLSPRVRGNLIGLTAGVIDEGSIPACAGEPYPRQQLIVLLRVYPRVCGGTGDNLHDAEVSAGLSPRVRGNL